MALFTVAVVTDLTYLNTAEMQWSNFSAWLIAWALLFGAPVLAWSIVDLFPRRPGGWRSRSFVHAALVVAMWLVGLVNAFWHARDAWASVETTGLALSVVTAVLALTAAFIGFQRRASGENG